MAQRIKIGNCYIIPLGDGKYAYCQYVHRHELLGALIRVFDRTTAQPLSSSEELRDAGTMFPPVFVGLYASVNSGRWKYLGYLPVGNFEFPKFRTLVGGPLKPGTYENWWIWDGKGDHFIGKLPTKLRSLELQLVWGDELLEERIQTGKNPYGEVV
jgi:hypothetical protein